MQLLEDNSYLYKNKRMPNKGLCTNLEWQVVLANIEKILQYLVD